MILVTTVMEKLLDFLTISTLVILVCTSILSTTAQEVHDKASSYVSISTRTVEIGDGNVAWVIDGAISDDDLQVTDVFLRPQKGFAFMHRNFQKNMSKSKWNADYPPWIIDVSVKEIEQHFPSASSIKNLIGDLLGKSVSFRAATVERIGANDAMRPSKRFCRENCHVLSIFLERVWRVNSYGQASFYSIMKGPTSDPGERLEITATVHPYGYRAILWPSCHTALFRAPSVNNFKPLELMHLWVTSNDLESSIGVHPIITAQGTRKNCSDFQFANAGKIDHPKHLFRTYYEFGKKTRPIHVFDDLFTREELYLWRDHLIACGNPGSLNFDTSLIEDNDNVQWMSMFKVEEFMRTDMWLRLLDVVKFVSNEGAWFPYDVALNYVRSADNTRIHPDSEPHQFEYTFVLYLNDDLKPENCGEIVFVQPSNHDDGLHRFLGDHPLTGQLFEPIAAIPPKFGRLVLFRNNIEHSAHPPCVNYPGARYSFAVKVSRTKRHAFIKRVYEIMENVRDNPKYTSWKEIDRELQLGLHDDATKSKLSTANLQKMYLRVKQEIDHLKEQRRTFQHLEL